MEISFGTLKQVDAGALIEAHHDLQRAADARSTDAAPVLQRAREIFERLGAAPALSERDVLLQEATALST